jgi:hypothetical protein
MTIVKPHIRKGKPVRGHIRKHKIQKVMPYYENLKVKIDGKWYFMRYDKLKGVEVKGQIVEKMTRTWLE